MRIVAALGGNALLERGEVPEAEIQQKHVEAAVTALAPLALENDLIVTHGNGPQVGLLALESARDPELPHPYPFDVLGAQTQGMIGYFLIQALDNALPGQQVVGMITQTLVAQDDPAFSDPTKFVGPIYSQAQSQRLSRRWGWQMRRDGTVWRRVVPSPEPKEIVELAAIRMLVGDGAVVVCAGGGGIPVTRHKDGTLRGVEAVIDKDLTAALLAKALNADLLLLLTDVTALEADYGTAAARPIRHITPLELAKMALPAGSMGPKAQAASQFVSGTNHVAAIGRLEQAADLVAGTSGTIITDH